jgi:hypothetical protein
MERNPKLLNISPSPYPKLHDYFGGRARICTIPEVEAFIVEAIGWVELNRAMAACARSIGVARHVKAEPDHALGSLDRPAEDSDPEILGLDYFVADGEVICNQLPALKSLWHAVGLFLNQLHRVPVESEPQIGWKQAVNVNILPRGSRGYEWHYDSTPITAVLFPFGLHTGRFKFFEDGEFRTVLGADVGMIYGVLSQIAHAVGPVYEAPLRISVPMAFSAPGAAPRSAEAAYLFGKK